MRPMTGQDWESRVNDVDRLDVFVQTAHYRIHDGRGRQDIPYLPVPLCLGASVADRLDDPVTSPTDRR